MKKGISLIAICACTALMTACSTTPADYSAVNETTAAVSAQQT